MQEQLYKTDDKDEIRDIQQKMLNVNTYNSKNRKKVKVNDQILADIDELLDFEIIKENLVEKGHDIGLTTATNIVREKRKKLKKHLFDKHMNLVKD